MPRAIWSGVISFGLVSVPVRMYTATKSKELKFHFLDKRDMALLDLMEALRQSVEATKKKKRAPAKKKTTTARKRTASRKAS